MFGGYLHRMFCVELYLKKDFDLNLLPDNFTGISPTLTRN